MKPVLWKLEEIVRATNGRLFSENKEKVFSGISIDSRQILSDDLFIAIKGENHDGHSFLDEVKSRGVKGAVIQGDKIKDLNVNKYAREGMSLIAVDNTIKALGNLANYRRRQCNVSVIAITGSNGKTTTKEMTALILSQRFKVLSTTGNLNNEIGLPLTLFHLNPEHEKAVLELGMNHLGEIRRLAEICMPDIGIITNIAPSHLEGLGSIESVRDAKGELLEKTNPEGTAALNADDPNVMSIAEKTSLKICLYGHSDKALIRAGAVINKGQGLLFELITPSESIMVELNVSGRFMISNALAAAAAGYLSGLKVLEIKSGLEAFRPVKGRMNILKTKSGINIIDDTYNANPYSMRAAIDTIKSLAGDNRKVFVLGDMLELGNYAKQMHYELGRTAFGSGPKNLFLTGDYAKDTASGAMELGMNPENIFIGTKEEIIKHIFEGFQPGDWILVKGSRSMKMETIVNSLI